MLHKAGACLVLTALGLVANVAAVPLLFGVDLLWGGVFGLLAVSLFGLRWGVPCAAAISAYTVILWGHPFALVIFTLEAALVAGLARRKALGLGSCDVLFWLLVGAPLVYLFYAGFLELPLDAVTLIMLKQPVNGMLNALIASLILTFTPQLRQRSPISLQAATGSVLAIFLLVPVLTTTVLHSTQLQRERVAALEVRMRSQLDSLELRLAEHPAAPPERLEPSGFPARLELWDSEWSLLASTGPGDSDLLAIPKPTALGLTLHAPLDDDLPAMTRWLRSAYTYTIRSEAIPGAWLRVTRPAAPLMRAAQATQRFQLGLLAIILAVGLLASSAVSRVVSRKLMTLASLSTDVPGLVATGAPLPTWPRSRVREIDTLSRNVDAMASALFEQLTAVRSSRDVLEERVSERTKELRLSEQRFATLSEATVEGVAIHTDWVISEFNTRLAEQVGREELCGRSFLDFVGSEDGDRLRAAGLANEVAALEVDILPPGGRPFTAEVSLGSSQFLGAPADVLTVRDISERKRIEDLKDDFVSTVSHELRTPLTSIRGGLSLLNFTAGEKLDDEGTQLLDLARRNVDRLLTLVDDLLDTQSLATGQLTLLAEPVELPVLLEQALGPHQGYAEELGCSLLLVAGPPAAEVVADPERLQQVIGNLVSNALKFSPPGAKVEVTWRSAGERWRVSVLDEGPGVPPEFIPQLFERFAQASSGSTRKQSGTGLGLNISRELIHRMQGDLDYTRSENRTEFWFELPRAVPPTL